MFKYTTALRLCTIASLVICYSAVAANEIERPCERSDLQGTWEVFVIRKLKELPVTYTNLLQPLQLLSYNESDQFRRITFSKQVPITQAISLLEITQPEKYQFAKTGVIATVNSNGQVAEIYGCSYFIADQAVGNIPKGTISLMWLFNGTPALLHAYRKISNP